MNSCAVTLSRSLSIGNTLFSVLLLPIMPRGGIHPYRCPSNPMKYGEQRFISSRQTAQICRSRSSSLAFLSVFTEWRKSINSIDNIYFSRNLLILDSTIERRASRSTSISLNVELIKMQMCFQCFIRLIISALCLANLKVQRFMVRQCIFERKCSIQIPLAGGIDSFRKRKAFLS